MRHRVYGYKLGRNTSHRKAMWRNMAIALFTHQQITTTVQKAKSVQPLVEKVITMARRGDLASYRRVIKVLGNPIIVDFDVKEVDRAERRAMKADGYVINKYGELLRGPKLVKKIFEEIAPKFADRPGGYTRIVRLGKHRIGDGADLCVLQLVGDEEGPQVSGQYSRRREKANRRMEFAAKLRKARSAGAEEAKPEVEEDTTATAVAEPEAVVEPETTTEEEKSE